MNSSGVDLQLELMPATSVVLELKCGISVFGCFQCDWLPRPSFSVRPVGRATCGSVLLFG